jgi:hypothetical protein
MQNEKTLLHFGINYTCWLNQDFITKDTKETAQQF